MLPFNIAKNSELGRFAIANQNFQAGDFLFEEFPFAVGPKVHSNCCCLECYLPLDATAPLARDVKNAHGRFAMSVLNPTSCRLTGENVKFSVHRNVNFTI